MLGFKLKPVRERGRWLILRCLTIITCNAIMFWLRGFSARFRHPRWLSYNLASSQEICIRFSLVAFSYGSVPVSFIHIRPSNFTDLAVIYLSRERRTTDSITESKWSTTKTCAYIVGHSWGWWVVDATKNSITGVFDIGLSPIRCQAITWNKYQDTNDSCFFFISKVSNLSFAKSRTSRSREFM